MELPIGVTLVKDTGTYWPGGQWRIPRDGPVPLVRTPGRGWLHYHETEWGEGRFKTEADLIKALQSSDEFTHDRKELGRDDVV